jgi:hypothetical protein
MSDIHECIQDKTNQFMDNEQANVRSDSSRVKIPTLNRVHRMSLSLCSDALTMGVEEARGGKAEGVDLM